MKKIVKKNQVIITSLAILIAVAGYLNFADVDLGFKDKEASTDSSSILDQVEYDLSDETALLDENGADGTTQSEVMDTASPGEAVLTGASDFAAQAKISREQVRSQNKADLQAIISNKDISDEEKQNAINTMVSMTDLTEKESAAELLLEAKGFENVIVNLTGETADVVVPDADLEDVKRAQIEDIVKRKTGVAAESIVITPLSQSKEAADDNTSDVTTTHFDYHSISGRLLKLDILGHDDPTVLRMLQDITGIDPKTIPLNDEKVLSLFTKPDALGVTKEELECEVGSYGLPEFGTKFVRQMLVDTQPKTFSDLVRISGFSHGTDVWLGNAQDLIKSGTATITTCICTRDDIMIYLINKGLEHGQAFTIMESVRKGKGLKPDWIEEMKSHGVPDWYIESCKKIKYMFPKAHAAAYVMMGWRIAYCKIYYPLAYYAAYFSIRATAFSYELMCQGKEKLEYFMDDYEKRKDTLSKKEQDTQKDMKIVQEMYARGFEFVPIDLYKANAHTFQIVDGKLMPALDTIEGLGDRAADAVVLAAEDGEFLSKDDFRNRTKVSKTVIELMSDLGLFGDLPESNQMSLFDFQ